ncbi:MAG: flavodoxin domain-containing protein [Bacteroidales bacterium]|nr:flavodoxin domain-containing protein [Bacteroidales bacterium]
MKTAIIYATTHGTTEKVALKMKELAGSENTFLFNLKEGSPFDINAFDAIIVGGSVHAGMLQKRVKDFCKEHTLELLQKPLGLFLCGMNEPEYEAQMEKNFPEILRQHSTAMETLGGEFLFDKMNFFQKLIVKKISGISESMHKINDEKIHEFISGMKLINQN